MKKEKILSGEYGIISVETVCDISYPAKPTIKKGTKGELEMHYNKWHFKDVKGKRISFTTDQILDNLKWFLVEVETRKIKSVKVVVEMTRHDGGYWEAEYETGSETQEISYILAHPERYKVEYE